MMGGYPMPGGLEVVDEGLLEVTPGVDGVGLQTLEPSERSHLQSHREVEDLCDGVSS